MPEKLNFMIFKFRFLVIHVINKKLGNRSSSFYSDEIFLIFVGLGYSYFHNFRVLVKSVLNGKILLPNRTHIPWTAWDLLRLSLRVISIINIGLIGWKVYIELIHCVIGDWIGPNKQVHTTPVVFNKRLSSPLYGLGAWLKFVALENVVQDGSVLFPDFISLVDDLGGVFVDVLHVNYWVQITMLKLDLN